MAAKAASWVDRNFYSTTGGATQNVFIMYGKYHYLYHINPTYCSKLVFQVFYYGDGFSCSHMHPRSGFVAPYELIGAFKMAPELVKIYSKK
ncbi:hypothetical protein [Bacillus toyonensis]|uniref:Uncharacterized protein n=1 Tax=Bacillus toyonensis TaxID=155322 RepID=A0A2A8HA48_9BACI|nr:hypothetical protein [Bacillus toyonensis]PEQ00052.1 hypothetical protein CN585_23250 [Bacillus toyonensis]